MTFNERLRKARRDTGMSQPEVCKHLQGKGYSVLPYTLSHWENGRREPSTIELLELCDLYGIDDMRYMLTGTYSVRSPLSPFEGLNQQGIVNVRTYIKFLKSNPEFTQEPEPIESRVFRLYDLPVSAGTGMYLDSSDYEEITADDLIPDDMDFAVRIRGDSMEPQYHDGQIIFIREQETLDNGEIGIFYLNGDAYLKKLQNNRLVSLNAKYKPITFQEHDEFRIFGKVIGTY